MILTESPRFEVINPRPTLGETLREFSLSEWATWVGVTAASASWGYAIGVFMPREHECVLTLDRDSSAPPWHSPPIDGFCWRCWFYRGPLSWRHPSAGVPRPG